MCILLIAIKRSQFFMFSLKLQCIHWNLKIRERCYVLIAMDHSSTKQPGCCRKIKYLTRDSRQNTFIVNCTLGKARQGPAKYTINIHCNLIKIYCESLIKFIVNCTLGKARQGREHKWGLKLWCKQTIYLVFILW